MQTRRSPQPSVPALSGHASRPTVHGKFLWRGGQRFYVRGVTYGTFRPNGEGLQFPEKQVIETDFAQMAGAGINAVRTYTVPPSWVLDLALANDLQVMVGVPWEQHVAFLDEPSLPGRIEERIREGARACAGHPALLCLVIGNEIPASIVRWHGPRKVERFIERLYRAAKEEDREALVTYVNYPTTEYLELPFLDLACFNVYLESKDSLEAYLARLQNLAGVRPLLMAEVGLDSRRNGEDRQAQVIHWQIEIAGAAGCAGLFTFAWTDEWHRGGRDVEDWDFGLTTRDRRPKPALAAVSHALAGFPFRLGIRWPRVSVVVCSYNGSRRIGETLAHLGRLDYPDYEIIVVDDGSQDGTGPLADSTGARVIRVPNGGLSRARNLGLEAATGEIVAYIDDDAYPEPDWLRYLALRFLGSDHAAVGGPNLPPPDDGPLAECIANAPGGPNHVLLSDTEAEHIPGCNMAFRKEHLREVGGFDPRFRVAGDDVDLCWRLIGKGWTIGFHAAAVVWHHRRASVRAYLKQQVGYGKAEALLAEKWPASYNRLGHVSWRGRIYAGGMPLASLASPRVYHGTWGQAPFQRVYQPQAGVLESLWQTPEWYLAILLGLSLGLLGGVWRPLFIPAGLAAIALLSRAFQVLRIVRRTRRASPGRNWSFKLEMLTALLHLLQPVARLWGRLRHGLTPWRVDRLAAFSLPWRRDILLWSEHWRSPHDWLSSLEDGIEFRGARCRRGGAFDSWDLEVRRGATAAVRLRLGIEDHEQGRQLLRFRVWPRLSGLIAGAAVTLAGLAAVAGVYGSPTLALLSACTAAWLAMRVVRDSVRASRLVREAARDLEALRDLVSLSPKGGAPGSRRCPSRTGQGRLTSSALPPLRQ